MKRIFTACIHRPALTIALAVFAVIVDHFILGPYSYLKWHDLGDVTFSRYLLIADGFNEYGQYSWFPYGAAGVDLLSNGFRFTDLFFVFFKILPYWLVIPVLRFIQLFIAGWFTFLVCRDSLKIPVGPALAGGLFFLFLQPNLIEFYFGFGALPLLVWTLEKIVKRTSWIPWLSVAGLGVAYSFAASVHLGIFYTFPGLFMWLWLIGKVRFWRLLPLMTVFGIFCLLPQVDMIWAMMENAALSHRSHWDLGVTSFADSVQKVISQSLSYLPLIILSCAGAILAWRDGDSRPLIIVVLVAVMSGSYILEYPIRQYLSSYIEIMRGFNLSRFALLQPFYLSFGAAWGLWLSTRAINAHKFTPILYAGAIGTMAIIPVLTLVGNVRDWVMWGNYVSIFESPEIKTVAREYRLSEEPFRVAVTQENGLQAGFLNAYGLETAGGYLNMYPYRYHVFWGVVIEPYRKRNPAFDKYFTTFGSRIMLATDDGHGLRINAADYFRTDLLSLVNVKYIITSVPLEGAGLELLEETKPERYWDDLDRDEKIQTRLVENFSGRHVMVYRNNNVLPRWFLAGARLFENQEELITSLRQGTEKELRRTALIPKEHAAAFMGIKSNVPPGSIDVKAYTPDMIRLEVSAPEPAVLVVSNSFSPHWRVSVDGEPTSLVPAYGTFWGVPMMPGKHKVVFSYEPPYALH